MNKEQQKQFDFILNELNKMPQLIHARKIVNYICRKEHLNCIYLILRCYYKYLKKMLEVQECTQQNVKEMTKYLNEYYASLKPFEKNFSAQGKFRSTILEEFLYFLFLPYINAFKKKHANTKSLESGNVDAYSNLYLNATDFQTFVTDPKISVNKKNQDYAIYSTIGVMFNNTSIDLHVPALAVEVKTFIDKTMLDGIIATAEKIKNGNPHARFIAVTETYEVGADVDPAYSRIDQIYVLRKDTKRGNAGDIDFTVVWNLYRESISHLERPWSDIKKKIGAEGKVL